MRPNSSCPATAVLPAPLGDRSLHGIWPSISTLSGVSHGFLVAYNQGSLRELQAGLVSSPSPSNTDIKKKGYISIVEDDRIYGRVLNYQLRSQGYVSELCSTSQRLFELIRSKGVPDLFILDFDLGEDEPSGLELCRKVISYCQRPVIMLTGNDSVETLVSCLNSGADQYIVKPCDIRELVARIEVTLRRSQLFKQSRKAPLFLTVDENITLSWEDECLTHSAGGEVQLTRKELALLELFLKEHNRFIDRRKAFQALYGYEMDPLNRSVDVLASKLRKKLRRLDDSYRIKTLRGHGYVLYKPK